MTVKNDHAALSRGRLAPIVELATWIAAENQTASGQTDVDRILRRKSITLSYGSYGDAFCGLIEHAAGRFHIYCNADRVGARDSGRARFTIAHELGHYFIDDHRACLMAGIGLHGSNIDYNPRNPVEQEADCFATNLLMPEPPFRAAAGQPAGLSTILVLQRRFAASITAAAVRYCDLEIEPVAVVLWSPKGYAWKRLSTKFRQANCRKTIESIQRIDEGSATHQALQALTVTSRGYHETASSVSRWFPFVAAGSRCDVLLRESAIQLGDYGCLTVLSLQPGEKLPS